MNFWPSCSTKIVVDTVLNFELWKHLFSVSTEIVFQSSQGLIQFIWGSKKECQHWKRVWKRMNFWPSWSAKKVVDTLLNFELWKHLFIVSTEIVFQSSQGLIQFIWGSKEECQHWNRVWKRMKFSPSLSTKKSCRCVVKFRALKTPI